MGNIGSCKSVTLDIVELLSLASNVPDGNSETEILRLKKLLKLLLCKNKLGQASKDNLINIIKKEVAELD